MRRAWGLGGMLMAVSACLSPIAAQAQPVTEIFKCRSESGQVTYTNDRRQAEKQKCQLVTSQQVNVAPASKSFPRETPRDSAKAKERQREILEKELRAEEQALTKARQTLAEQQTVRSGDERNYARVQERLQPIQDTIQNHEKNIQALQRELGNLK
jgi:hypothetical protein